jgi:hypothetical protein
MALTYTWKVTGIKTKDEGANAQAVVQTYWTKTGTDEAGNTGTFAGATPFTSVEVPEGQFIPLAQLTEETVIGWIQSVVVDGYEEHVNAQIQKQIDEKITPIAEPTLPWAPPQIQSIEPVVESPVVEPMVEETQQPTV